MHPTRRECLNAQLARVRFRDRTYGHVFTRHHRYATSRSLFEHDRADAGADLSSVSIAKMEVVTMADPADKAKPKKIHRLQIGLNVLVQPILTFFLVPAVNWLGFRHYKPWDVSPDP